MKPEETVAAAQPRQAARPSPILELRDVSFTYALTESPALDTVSLSVSPGECVVLTGESGCGKTTLTRLMNGLIPVVYKGDFTGSVSIMGIPLGEWRMDRLSGCVGSVFQNPRSQFVNKDTTSEIAFGCESLGLARIDIVDRVDNATRDLGIPELLNREVECLSGGQKQMVILASVYAAHPDIFVLDEPTASLDVVAMRRLAKALAHLKEQGKTIIVSEHRLWWLAEIADRVVVLEQGRIKGTWSRADFGALGTNRRMEMGLRAWSADEMDERRSSGPTRKQRARTPLVKAEGLAAGYRRTPDVLRSLDFSLDSGRCVGLVGRNGAGKTTLVRCLAGLLKERQGRISVCNEVLPWRKRAGRIYLVMQEPGYQLFSNTAQGELEESLARGGVTGDEAQRRARALQQELGLEQCSTRHPLSLSGGQRQRLSIAAGLLYGADAMVMDEPTSGLDYRNMHRVVVQVKRMLELGLSVCVISHDYEFVCEVCDDIAYLDGGEITQVHELNESTLPLLKERFGFKETI